MYGAILGDIIGSPYEFDMGDKTKDFPLFSKNSTYTDDTVMTLAVAEAFLAMLPGEDVDVTRQRLIEKMQHWGKRSPRGLRRPVRLVAQRGASGALRKLRKRLCHAGVLRGVAV